MSGEKHLTQLLTFKIMKTIIAFILFFLTMNIVCYSQVFAGYGIKGGLALAHLSEKRTYETSYEFTNNTTGAVIGVFGDFFSYKIFSTTLEINFEQKGDSWGRSDNSTINVISIPLSAKIYMPFPSVQPYISGGPRIDFVLNAKDKATEQGFYSGINPVSFGITFSLGCEVNLTKKSSIILEASLSPDFTTSIGHYGNLLDNYYNYKSISFEFKTGLKFNRL